MHAVHSSLTQLSQSCCEFTRAAAMTGTHAHARWSLSLLSKPTTGNTVTRVCMGRATLPAALHTLAYCVLAQQTAGCLWWGSTSITPSCACKLPLAAAQSARAHSQDPRPGPHLQHQQLLPLPLPQLLPLLLLPPLLPLLLLLLRLPQPLPPLLHWPPVRVPAHIQFTDASVEPAGGRICTCILTAQLQPCACIYACMHARSPSANSRRVMSSHSANCQHTSGFKTNLLLLRSKWHVWFDTCLAMVHTSLCVIQDAECILPPAQLHGSHRSCELQHPLCLLQLG